MDLRVQFIADWQTGAWSMTELCADYRVSRKTGYKWIGRYEALGARGLHDLSRRPRHHPSAIAAATLDELLRLRRRHPHWGATKLLAVARRRDPGAAWPSRSAVCDHLRRAGLVVSRRRAPARCAGGTALTPPTQANAVWTIDFKGQFRTGDRRYCYPLTLRDGYSRFVLRCDARLTTSGELVRRSLTHAFRAYGLPACIRSDNGAPFARPGLAGLSQLSVWWIRLGIRPERIAPGHPEQNGSHEQFHAVLKRETTRPPAADCAAQHRRFARFRRAYNEQRPHEALANATPASRYDASSRPLPSRLPPLEYPGYWEIRRVSANGCIRWHNTPIFLSKALIGEDVALEEVDDGLWTLRLGAIALARFDERQRAVHPLAQTTEGREAATPPRAE